ncbi:MAG: Rpn family recombination-promoting nuclease/putative transposase [Clostridiales bacterium]|nr:Rpn family recombination-promoting nuclease/putative transposase [Clostridiales bacterium]
MEGVNREIKDGVFKLLFEKPENAAELYYALTGEKCRPEDIQIITLETTISGRLKNDLAFVVGDRVLVVGEHQSTPNENMPIRILMYVGQLYEKWFKMKGDGKLLYAKKLHKIPKPEFAVFYNGAAKRPQKEVLRLSDAFNAPQSDNLGFLELEVPVYNINAGMGGSLVKDSEKLRQYSEFVAKLQEFQKIYDDFGRAVKNAVNYCIDNNILAELLREIGGKIVSILAMEYDVEMDKRVYAEELLEDRLAEVAKKLLRRGVPFQVIAEEIGLSEAAVRQLKYELGR